MKRKYKFYLKQMGWIRMIFFALAIMFFGSIFEMLFGVSNVALFVFLGMTLLWIIGYFNKPINKFYNGIAINIMGIENTGVKLFKNGKWEKLRIIGIDKKTGLIRAKE